MATTRNTGCCAVQEIEGLSWKRGQKPEEALREIFKAQVRYGNEYSISSFYTFTGVVGYKYLDDGPYLDRQEYRECTEDLDVEYGARLAAFIVKNKLGSVVTTKPEWNRVNHPDHKVQVWVWRPDAIRLLAWLRKPVKSKKSGIKVTKKVA